MDRKSIVVLVVSFALLIAWYPLMQKLGVIQSTPPPSTNQVIAPTDPAAVSPSAVPDRASAPPERPAPALTAARDPAPVLPSFSEPERIELLENDNARYSFTSHGGGLKLIELKKYPEVVVAKRKRALTTNNVATLNTSAPVPVLALLGAGLQEDGVFRLTRTSSRGVRAEKVLSNGLSIIKDFELGTNYLVFATVRIENRTAQPVRVPAQEWVIGTATPMTAHDQSMLVGMQWYNGTKATLIGESWFANRTLGCFPGTRRTEYQAGNQDVAWASVHNQFFAIAAVPSTNAPQIVAREVVLPAPADELAEAKPTPSLTGYQTAFRYAEGNLAAQSVVERKVALFAGPKEYNTLSRLGVAFGNNLDLVMQFDGFFGWFAKALLLSMNGLNKLGLSYGMAIIAITVIIKLLFWPLTNASTKSMKRMAALQPQMKALQEKYKDDPRKMNQKLMEFMKEHKVSPLGGCLPMLLQIPVFFGFYKMLQSAIELRGATFLWAYDLSRPDTIWNIPGFQFPVNPLPLIMGATMLWQARLTPPSPGMDPVQQTMMRYMPLMFMVFLYNFSAGLTLYWTVQNLLSIAQMKLTRGDQPPTGGAASPAPPGPVKPAKPIPPKPRK
jgi:YidC/Oxa1 family membrane protein insertase